MNPDCCLVNEQLLLHVVVNDWSFYTVVLGGRGERRGGGDVEDKSQVIQKS